MYLVFLIGGLVTVILDLMIGSYVLLGIGLAAILAGAIGWATALTLPLLTLIFLVGAIVFVKATLTLKNNSKDADVGNAIVNAYAGTVIPVLSLAPFKVLYRGVPYDAKWIDGVQAGDDIQNVVVVREEGLFVLVTTQGEKNV